MIYESKFGVQLGKHRHGVTVLRCCGVAVVRYESCMNTK